MGLVILQISFGVGIAVVVRRRRNARRARLHRSPLTQIMEMEAMLNNLTRHTQGFECHSHYHIPRLKLSRVNEALFLQFELGEEGSPEHIYEIPEGEEDYVFPPPDFFQRARQDEVRAVLV